MSVPPIAAEHPGPQTLATATLPRRVRRVLEHLLNAASDELEQHLTDVLAEFEQQLFRLADHANNPGIESGHLQTLRTLRLNRADLLPRFMAGLEANIATLTRDSGGAIGKRLPAAFHDLSLVEHTEMDEVSVLREIAVRQE